MNHRHPENTRDALISINIGIYADMAISAISVKCSLEIAKINIPL